MSPRDVTGWLICVVLGAGWVWLMPRFWRNERGVDSDTPHPYWPWGVRLWRALVRIGPLAGAMFIAGAGLMPLERLVTDELWHGVAVAVTVMVFVPIFFLFFSVILLNRPKRVVAPHHRHQHGLIAELLGKRSAPTPPPAVLPGWQREPRRRAPVP